MDLEVNQVNGDDKELKGLVNKGLVNFECADCGKPLLVLQLTSIEGDRGAQVLTRVVVKCQECGGFSHVQSIAGCFHPGAPNDNMAFDILDDDTGVPEAEVLFKAWDK